MAESLFLTDGRIEIIFSDRDFLELVDRCMGSDARGWLEERLAEKESDADYINDLEKETDIRTSAFERVVNLQIGFSPLGNEEIIHADAFLCGGSAYYSEQSQGDK